LRLSGAEFMLISVSKVTGFIAIRNSTFLIGQACSQNLGPPSFALKG
jgi:hypothetical protein